MKGFVISLGVLCVILTRIFISKTRLLLNLLTFYTLISKMKQFQAELDQYILFGTNSIKYKKKKFCPSLKGYYENYL